MYDSITEVRRAIREIVFANLLADDSVCFDLEITDDAGPVGRGDLFEQDHEFFMVETVIDETRPAGPGVTSPTRVWGAVDLRFLTKSGLDELGAHQRLEDVGGWFADKTIEGIRFRQFLPTDKGRLLGFIRYAATVPFECEIKRKGA